MILKENLRENKGEYNATYNYSNNNIIWAINNMGMEKPRRN